MSEISNYEKQRQINIEQNRKVLESLGLLKPFGNILHRKNTQPPGIKKKQKRKREERTQTKEENPNCLDESNFCYPRRSLRVRGVKAETIQETDFVDDENDKTYAKPSLPVKRDNAYGNIEGVPVGTTWATRLGCNYDGIHRPTVAGIHGNATEGCYSLALSGGYEDDIDLGDSFTYTGEGGRDLKGTKANPKNLRTAPQSKDQALTKGNLALTKNVENRRPVRVIRGYKLNSVYAPEEGYRYDGLYTVERYWQAVGLSGYKVYKFVLKRCPNQEPIPLSTSDEN